MKNESKQNSWKVSETGQLSKKVVFELSGDIKQGPAHLYKVLDSEMNELPELQRVSLHLYHQEGMSTQDLVEILSLSEFSIGLHLERGLKNLRLGMSRAGHSLSIAQMAKTLKSQPKEVAPERLVRKIMSMVLEGKEV